MATPKEMWDNFINHLNQSDPLGGVKMEKVGKQLVRTNEVKPHMNMMGSVESYRKLFMEANKDAM